MQHRTEYKIGGNSVIYIIGDFAYASLKQDGQALPIQEFRKEECEFYSKIPGINLGGDFHKIETPDNGPLTISIFGNTKTNYPIGIILGAKPTVSSF